jgi:hypothetical protein
MTSKFFDSVFQTVSGRTQPVSGALVYVYETGTTTLATIYEDDGTTAQTNPITTDSNGNYEFRADDDVYDIRITYSGFDKTFSGYTIGSSIADGAVTTAKLADDAVTLAKMASGTAGNLITYDASGDPESVATGNSGEVLTSNGAGSAPTFQPAAGGGGTNTPYFKARMSALQSIGASTETKIQFDTEIFDSDGDYDPTTNYRFTPQTAGKYNVHIRINLQGNGSDMRLILYKNGTQAEITKIIASSSAGGFMQLTTSIDMNGTTDYIEAYAYTNAASSRNILHQTNYAGVWSSIFMAERIAE